MYLHLRWRYKEKRKENYYTTTTLNISLSNYIYHRFSSNHNIKFQEIFIKSWAGNTPKTLHEPRFDIIKNSKFNNHSQKEKQGISQRTVLTPLLKTPPWSLARTIQRRSIGNGLSCMKMKCILNTSPMSSWQMTQTNPPPQSTQNLVYSINSPNPLPKIRAATTNFHLCN